MKNLRSSNGFSLIELLIVVVIIGILAAIATSGFLSSKRTANEGSAVSSMRTLHGAQMTYSTSLGGGEFAGDIGAGSNAGLALLHTKGFIDDVLGNGSKSGFLMVGGREQSSATLPAQFFFSAVPSSTYPLTATGNHRVGITTDGVLRSDSTVGVHYVNTAEAAAAPPINN